MEEKKKKKSLTIYHVHFFDEGMANKDCYFGSISAIYDCFSKEQIGIIASSLYNFNLDEEENPVYENKKCRIRKSILITKSKK